MDALPANPPSRLVDYSATPLGELVEELLSNTKDPELLVARECSRARPTLEALGQERHRTRERIRQKVAEDTELVRRLLTSERFQLVRSTAKKLQFEFGFIISPECELVKQWRARLGERLFEILRWLSNYVYEEEWLLQDGNTLKNFRRELDNAIGDKWLIEAEQLFADLKIQVRLETALSFLEMSGVWRNIGGGWLVRWDGPIQAKVERVLRLVGHPMTPDQLIDRIGHGASRSLKNEYKYNPTLIRIDKDFRLALREWGYKEYKNISTEINQRIDSGGGVASLSAMLAEFVPAFGVKEASVRSSLKVGPYVVKGDEVRHLTNREYTPKSVSERKHAIRIGNIWGQRFTVSDSNLRGYSFNLDRDIAAHNGILPEDSLLVPATYEGRVLGKASLIWRLTNSSRTVDVGRLSSILKELGIGAGDEIIILATPESCSVLLPVQGNLASSGHGT